MTLRKRERVIAKFVHRIDIQVFQLDDRNATENGFPMNSMNHR
jgi:hypothetical protein